jgi:hypothetical protein
MWIYLTDWIGSFLRDFLSISTPMLPVAVATVLAGLHFRANRLAAFRRQLCAATLAGVVALALVSDKLFGEAHYAASMGNLIFPFALMCACVAWLLGYGIGHAIDKMKTRKATPAHTTLWGLCLPSALICIYLAGAARYIAPSVDRDLAARSIQAETLRRIEVQDVVMAVTMAENRAAPADVLDQLGQHANNIVRMGVSRHPNASKDLLLKLALDCNARVREKAKSRLDGTDALVSQGQPTADCPDDGAPMRAYR